HKIARAIDPAPVAERFRDRLAERDPQIFDRVMLIYVEIAGRLDLQIETAVPGEELEHVVEEPDSCRDLVAPSAFETDCQGDLRLGRLPIDYRAPHSTSSSTARPRRVCSTMPAVMRMQPSHPGSLPRS